MGLLAVVRHVTHAPLRARKLGRLISLSLSLCLAPFPSLSLALAARWQRQRAAHLSRSKLHGDCGARSAAASYKPPMLVTRPRLPACAICSAALLRSPTSGARFTYHCSAALPAGMQYRSPLYQTRGAKAPTCRRQRRERTRSVLAPRRRASVSLAFSKAVVLFRQARHGKESIHFFALQHRTEDYKRGTG